MHKVPLMLSSRVCPVHRMCLDLHRLFKKLTRLMPSCIVFVGLIALLLLTVIQLVTYQPDFVHYSTLPEPQSELIRTLNSTNSRNSNNNTTSLNTNYVHNVNTTSSFKSSSMTSSKASQSKATFLTTTSAVSSNSLNSVTSKSTFLMASTFQPSTSKSRSANSTSSTLINVTHHDLNRPGLSRMIISSNKSSLLKAKKSDPFKIEALLSQSPSAFQTNNREMNELTNKGRIKQIIKHFLSEQRLEKVKLENNLTLFSSNDTSQKHQIGSNLSNQTFEHCPLSPPNLGKIISLFFQYFRF